jgi:ElaB/YqjD/DUF883 family membrane-anchored ribosome-binding protein
MSLLAVPIIAVLALFLVVVSSAVIFLYFVRVTKNIKGFKVQLQSNVMQIKELKDLNKLLQHQITSTEREGKQLSIENSQVLKQLELRIKYLNDYNVEQQKKLLQWQDSHGQDKFYNRAFKLAAKGASLEEIMNECELPRAEVEMLLSVHQSRL